MRRPWKYQAVAYHSEVDGRLLGFGIKGAWKTINSTMPFFKTKAEADAAIARMTVEPRVVQIRKVPRP